MLKRMFTILVMLAGLLTPNFANDALPDVLNWASGTQPTPQASAGSAEMPVAPAMAAQKPPLPPLSQRLKPLNRACLPQAGRMLKNESAACHCPPQELCPKDLDEWVQGVGLPPDIATICCSKPKECAFDRINFVSCGLGNGITTNKEEYCYKYSVSSDFTKEAPYKSALLKVNLINNRIAALKTRISALVDGNDTSGAAFNSGVSLVAQIRAEIAKLGLNNAPNKAVTTEASFKSLPSNIADIFALNSVENAQAGADVLAGEKSADSTLKAECTSTAKTTFCTKQVSETCPPLPDVDPCANSGITAAEIVTPNRTLNSKTPPNRCWCPTGTISKREPRFANADGSSDYTCFIPYDCVLKSTKITMGDGSLKNIEEIRVGEFVKGFMSINKVMAVTLNEDETRLYAINQDKLIVTAGHPILTRKGWKAIDVGMVVGEQSFIKDLTKLELGDEILMTDETIVTVTSLDIHEQKNASKYNLSVGGDHTFTANGMVIRAFKANTTY